MKWAEAGARPSTDMRSSLYSALIIDTAGASRMTGRAWVVSARDSLSPSSLELADPSYRTGLVETGDAIVAKKEALRIEVGIGCPTTGASLC